MGKIRGVCYRDPPHLDPGVAVHHVVRFAVVDHLECLYLPNRRAGRVLLAQFARRIDRIVQLRLDAVSELPSSRSESRLVRHQEAKITGDSVPEVAG